MNEVTAQDQILRFFNNKQINKMKVMVLYIAPKADSY